MMLAITSYKACLYSNFFSITPLHPPTKKKNTLLVEWIIWLKLRLPISLSQDVFPGTNLMLDRPALDLHFMYTLWWTLFIVSNFSQVQNCSYCKVVSTDGSGAFKQSTPRVYLSISVSHNYILALNIKFASSHC